MVITALTRRQFFLLASIVTGVLLGVGGFFYYRNLLPHSFLEAPSQINKTIFERHSNQKATINGTVLNVSSTNQIITLLTQDKQELAVVTTSQTKFINQNDIIDDF